MAGGVCGISAAIPCAGQIAKLFGLGSLGQSPKLRKPKRYAFWFGIHAGRLSPFGLGKAALFSTESAAIFL
jgi:hypothetical protein